MTASETSHGLTIHPTLAAFVEQELLPLIDIDRDRFWSGLARIVTELTPEDGRAFYYLGVVYDKAGMVDEAKQHYRAADNKIQRSGLQSAVL